MIFWYKPVSLNLLVFEEQFRFHALIAEYLINFFKTWNIVNTEGPPILKNRVSVF
jgi:hypothetical protein